MAHVSYPFKKTNKIIFQKPVSVVTKDSIYWKKLGSPVLIKEFGAIDYLDFSPVEPHYFAATCSVRVQVYDPITKVVAKNISKFVEAAYGGTFRDDGRLLVAGSEEAAVKLFDIQSKNVLRVFTGHTAPVHRTFFSKDQVKVLSFSDDKSVSLWDIASEERIATFSEHTDYVRAGAPSPISPDVIVSGGYDHSVKLYDCRTSQQVLSVNHGSPVESTIFLPSGGIFISAGGTEIKAWDIINGGRLLASISQHHKTVTALRLASNNSRLVSASLDRHVKVFDIATFKMVHNIDFPNAILSLAVSENDDMLAVGMVDGVISIRKREESSRHTKQSRRGGYKFAPDHFETHTSSIPTVDTVVSKKGANAAPEHEKYLRKMEFSKALSVVLKNYVTSRLPETTAALMQELLRRKVLHIAMDGLEEKHIGAVLKYFIKYLGEIRFTRIVIDSMNVFIDVFEDRIDTFSDELRSLYGKLLANINEEIEVTQKVCELEGAISLLLAAGDVDTPQETLDINEVLAPSVKARKEIVIDL